jgi:quercetin dioxygenase-like cupin family protein
MVKKSLLISALVMAAVAGIVIARAERASAQAGKSAIVWPIADIKWMDNPAIKGGKIAVLWGDPKAGGYGSLKKIPGGTTLGMHTHTSDQKVIAISGTIALALDGSPSRDFAPGSYAFIPGGTKHTADCKAGADCTYFEEQPGPSDLKPAN